MDLEYKNCGSYLLIVLTICCLPAAATIEKDALAEGTSLEFILEAIEKNELRQWPHIYTSRSAATLSPSEYQMQAAYRKTSATLITDLAMLSKQTGVPVSDAIINASALLKWRDLLYQNPSYHNLLLAEMVNRILVIKLADKALLMDKDNRMAASNLLKLVRGTRIPMECWRIVLDQELYGKSLRSAAAPKLHEPEDAAKSCLGFWAEMERVDHILCPTNSTKGAISSLQEHPEMALLLHRYIETYAKIRSLEMLYDYVSQTPTASVSEGLLQIANVFPIISDTSFKITADGIKKIRIRYQPDSKWSVREVLVDSPNAAYEVYGILNASASDRLSEWIFFLNYPDLDNLHPVLESKTQNHPRGQGAGS